MPCYHPLHGYKSKHLNPTGKRSIVFKLRNGLLSEPVSVPCGRCIGCRLESSRQWALRCVHEAQLHEDNAFITLTYAPDQLPAGGTFNKKHFTDFMKRVRKHFGTNNKTGKKLSYYMCGEYGETTRRPHYHALLFGVRFLDQQPFKRSADGSVLFTSATLTQLWPYGFATVGEVTFESAAYVARYIMKKITGAQAEDHYTVTDPETGEIHKLWPEYTRMSLKPAIAKDWYRDFKGDVFPSDEVVIRGKQMKPPKYYDGQLEHDDPELHARIKEERKAAAAAHAEHSTKRRLQDRETVKLAQISNLKRTIE